MEVQASEDTAELTRLLESLGPDELEEFASTLDGAEMNGLWAYLHDWSLTARPDQLEPGGGWYYWVIQCGRGWGKTITAEQFVRSRVDRGIWRTVNVIGPTWTDVMDTMVSGSDGAPGLMGVWPPHQRPKLKLSSDNPHMICWNGAKIRLRAAHSAERVRGPQADGGWAEEVDAWRPTHMTAQEAFALYEMGVRIGQDPRIVVTSTPKRGRIVAMLRQRGAARPGLVHVTRGGMRDNIANLAPQFVALMRDNYEGTRLGRQELDGELLEDVAGALILQETIDNHREPAPELSALERVVVGVDPSGGGDDEGDEKGIVVGGRLRGHAYLLADKTTKLGPNGWGRVAVQAYLDFDADVIVAEKNYGGEMVRYVVESCAKDMGVPVPPVRLVNASRGKNVRAEPIASKYDQGRVHHCGEFKKLEAQLCSFTDEGYDGEGSPDRGDAWVWATTDLLVKSAGLSPSQLAQMAEEEERQAEAAEEAERRAHAARKRAATDHRGGRNGGGPISVYT